MFNVVRATYVSPANFIKEIGKLFFPLQYYK
jgi:hypothetical protein